jgi:NADH/NAD ratio-sensing transcriptional regulator Rex
MPGEETVMRKKKIPHAVLLRMAQYLRLVLAAGDGKTMLTSSQLGLMTGYGAARVRNDFHYFGDFGVLGRGYDRETLRSCLEDIFGLGQKQAVLVLGQDPIAQIMLKRDLCVDYEFEVLTEDDLAEVKSA